MRAGLTRHDSSHRRRAMVFALLLLVVAFFALPVVSIDSPLSSVVLDHDGRLLGASVASDEQWRFPGTGQVPEKVRSAVLRYEDSRFPWHPGVDPLAVGRALRLNLSHGEVVSGASTITMQVVRIARGNPARTPGEKLIEAALALRLEAARSKAEILAMYVENAPFGGNTVGLEAASWRYFGRRPAELSWAEAATLAVLPNSPALIHPGRNRAALKAKRDTLLLRLRDEGALDARACAAAIDEPLPEVLRALPQDAPHLLASAPGQRVQSTLDQELQRRATEVVARHHRALAAGGVHNAAALMVDMATGDVLAYVGNVPPGAVLGSYVDVVRAARSTGSLLKPFLYASMLEDGGLLPRQLVPDVPARIGGFAPENFDRAYVGALPAAAALARSRNVPAVWMLRDHGVERFAAKLRKLGMGTLFRPASDYGLSLIVGGAEGSLWDLVGMYRDLGLSVTHADGPLPAALHWRADEPVETRAPVWDPAAAWLTLEALYEVNRPGVESGWRTFRGAERVAWKTGTSHGFRDAWAVGLTPEVAIGVWAGNADGEGRPDLTGYQAAAPILFDLFDLVQSRGRFDAPDAHLVTVEVCAHSGKLAGPDCEDTRTARVPRAGQRGPSCDLCRSISCDAGCQHRVHSECEAVSAMETRSWFVLPPAQEYFYSREHPEYEPLPPLREDCREAVRTAPPMACLSPAPDAEVFVPIELDGERGAVVFEASHRDAAAEIYWHLDDTYVGTTASPHQLAVSPEPGQHKVTLVDADGARVERRFRVLERR